MLKWNSILASKLFKEGACITLLESPLILQCGLERTQFVSYRHQVIMGSRVPSNRIQTIQSVVQLDHVAPPPQRCITLLSHARSLFVSLLLKTVGILVPCSWTFSKAYISPLRWALQTTDAYSRRGLTNDIATQNPDTRMFSPVSPGPINSAHNLVGMPSPSHVIRNKHTKVSFTLRLLRSTTHFAFNFINQSWFN